MSRDGAALISVSVDFMNYTPKTPPPNIGLVYCKALGSGNDGGRGCEIQNLYYCTAVRVLYTGMQYDANFTKGNL